jgi:geranylgeranyl transferase type-2 subunit beta
MSLVSGPGRGGGGLPAGTLPNDLLAIGKHVEYIQKLDTVRTCEWCCLSRLILGQRKDELEYWYTEHLRMNGIYWGLTALHLLGAPDALPRDATIKFVLACQNDDSGFGAAPGHDSHMLYTVSAVQILATIDALPELDKSAKGSREEVGQCRFFLAALASFYCWPT